jgi:hypothetical protein
MPFKPVETLQTAIYSLIILQNYAKKIFSFFQNFEKSSNSLETIQTPDYSLIVLKKGKKPKKKFELFLKIFSKFSKFSKSKPNPTLDLPWGLFIQTFSKIR